MTTTHKVLMFTDQVASTSRTNQRTGAEKKQVDHDQQQLTASVLARYRGVILGDRGDGKFIEFPSCGDAVRCGFALQKEVAARNAAQKNELLRFDLHVGVDCGEVEIGTNGDILGNAANIAARVTGLCPPGEVYFTDDVRKNLHEREAAAEPLPALILKGVTHPPAVHRLVQWLGKLEPALNPFIWRGGITQAEDFFGRENEQSALRNFVLGRQHCQIVGQRRIGKTSLLRQVERKVPGWDKNALVAYLDLQDPRCYTLAGWLQRVSRQFAISQPLNTVAHLADWVENTIKGGRHPVLCLDEFEELAHRRGEFTRDFFLALRSCGQLGLSIVTASKAPLSQVTDPADDTSPFYNTFPLLSLGKFSPDEAEDFVTIFRAGVAPFSTEEKSAILSSADGHPLVLQVGCFHVLQAKQNGEALSAALQRAGAEYKAMLPRS